jgi:hypothetical protein
MGRGRATPRELWDRQSAVEALAEAQAAACAAIGLRGPAAGRAMRMARRETRRTRADERWMLISRGARATRMAQRKPGEGRPWPKASLDQSSIGDA